MKDDHDLGQSQPSSVIMYVDFVTSSGPGQPAQATATELIDKERQLLVQASGKFGGRGSRLTSDREAEVGLKGWLRGTAPKERAMRQSSYTLLEFKSPLEAVRCAVEFQRALQKHNRAVPRDLELHVGVGIHTGEFEIKGEEVIGEALGIVSRIWHLGGPGGVCITSDVEKQIHNSLEEPTVNLGARLEGIANHLDVYMLDLTGKRAEKQAEELSRTRVAVLPFVSISSDPQDEFFADGLTEELIDRLAQVRELEVIARTSVMVFKKKEKRVADIGRELKAGSLVEGSVRKAGNKIRVTAQLVDANTEGHLWSSRYDKDLEDIFAVQGDIARQVVEALRVTLLPNEKKVIQKEATKNMRAYEFYLKGHFHWNERTETSVRKGIEYLKKAIEEDPDFAAAYSDLADCYVMATDYAMMKGEEARSFVNEYARMALERDPTLSQPHAALAAMHERNYDWADAEREFKLAIELNPNNVMAHHWYALDCYFRGKTELALREWDKARQLDPLSLVVNSAYGTGLALSGREQEGIAMLRGVLEIDESFPVSHRNLGFAYVSAGNIEEAAKEAATLEALESGIGYKGHAGWIFAKAGRREDAHRILAELQERSRAQYVDPAVIAMIHAGLGNAAEAFEWLNSAVENKSAGVPYVTFAPAFDTLRSDPRYKRIMNKAGLE